MHGVVWLTNVENSEPVGIPLARIAMIEQKPMGEGNVVAIHLDTGKEVRVIETLTILKARISSADGLHGVGTHSSG